MSQGVKRRLIIIAIVAMGSVLVIVAFYSITLWRGRAAWERYANDARGRGIKLSLMEFVPPPIPDDQNMAATPVFQNAFARKDADPNPPFKFPGKPPTLSANRTKEVDFEAWRKYCIEQNWIADKAEESAPEATLRALNAKFGADWEQLRAASERTRARFPVEWEKNFFARIPHLTILLGAARLGTLRCEAQMALGKREAAFQELRTVMRLGVMLEKEPELITYLMQMAILQQPVECLHHGLDIHLWDDQSLSSLQQEIDSVKPLEAYAFGLASERGFLNDVYARFYIRRSTKDVQEIVDAWRFGDVPISHRFLDLYPTGWLYDNQLRGNRAHDGMLARVDLMEHRFRPERAKVDANDKPSGRLEALHYLLFFLGQSTTLKCEEKALHMHTLLQTARIGIQLERWRLEQGSYPDSLGEIVLPEGVVAHDVIDGAPLRYRKTGDNAYVLYSVALNGRDDGAAEAEGRRPQEQPDWVWRVPTR